MEGKNLAGTWKLEVTDDILPLADCPHNRPWGSRIASQSLAILLAIA